jgi:hypothetical protein
MYKVKLFFISSVNIIVSEMFLSKSDFDFFSGEQSAGHTTGHH